MTTRPDPHDSRRDSVELGAGLAGAPIGPQGFPVHPHTHEPTDLCACGHTYEQHEARNGYCPLRLNEKFRPAPDLPVMALRPDKHGEDVTIGTLMDDIVVENVVTFRAEAMDTNLWWVCCRFANGEEVVWHVRALSRPLRIEWEQGELPDYIDWDKHPEARSRAQR